MRGHSIENVYILTNICNININIYIYKYTYTYKCICIYTHRYIYIYIPTYTVNAKCEKMKNVGGWAVRSD